MQFNIAKSCAAIPAAFDEKIKKGGSMQLNLTTDYAVKTMVVLGESDKLLTAEQIGKEVGVSVNYLMRILKKLEKEGLLNVGRGRNGGYDLAKSPDDISLYEILKIMEPTIRINRCLEEDYHCSRDTANKCTIRRVYLRIQETMEDELKRHTIGKLLRKAE